MTIVRVWADGVWPPSARDRLVEAMALCDDAAADGTDRVGDTTALALLDHASAAGADVDARFDTVALSPGQWAAAHRDEIPREATVG